MRLKKGKKKLVVVDVAGLSYKLARSIHLPGLQFQPLTTAFPAVTCTVQAVFRTATAVKDNNMPGNGFFERSLARPFFWEQSAALVSGERIWQAFRQTGGKVGLMFWQQSLGEAADLILSPAPVHKHHGGMIQDCYSKPAHLYQLLCAELGRPFDLKHYWGPLASYKSSAWITAAACTVLNKPEIAPDLLLIYLPVLDYDLQRFGPDGVQAERALEQVNNQLQMLARTAGSRGYELLVFGDYALDAVSGGPLYPNRILLEHGLFKVRQVKGLQYPDYYESPVFALTDHEVAHLYCREPNLFSRVVKIFQAERGVGQILDREAQKKAGLACDRAGDLLLSARAGYWFAYPWWDKAQLAPDYARHVDIHNKPGYDPGELFFGRLPFSVSLEAGKVKGTHGQNSVNRATCWACSAKMDIQPVTLLELARGVKAYLNS